MPTELTVGSLGKRAGAFSTVARLTEAPVYSNRSKEGEPDPTVSVLTGETFKLEMKIGRSILGSPFLSTNPSVSYPSFDDFNIPSSDSNASPLQSSDTLFYTPLIVSIDTCAGASMIRKTASLEEFISSHRKVSHSGPHEERSLKKKVLSLSLSALERLSFQPWICL